MRGYFFIYTGLAVLSTADVYFGNDETHVNVTYGVRKTVNLTCSGTFTHNTTVVWSKKGVLSPLAVGGKILTDKERYRTYQDENTAVLGIIVPGVSDAGIYKCTYTLDRNNISTTLFFLTRTGKHFTHIVTKKQVVKARVGGDVDLPCTVQRRHKNTVLWLDPQSRVVTYGRKSLKIRFKISSRRHRRNWTLTIKRVRKSDFGHYTCLVSTDPVLSHVITLKKEETVSSSTVSSIISTTTVLDKAFQIKNITIETSTSLYSLPKIGATFRRQDKSDNGLDHLILGLSVCGFILSVVMVAGCYLFHRMQKMTRRIVQQEIHLENTRMRRRDRRLTSETQVYIGRPSDSSKHNVESFKETEFVDGGISPKQKKSKRPNPYCDPWSSHSDIIAAMNAAYTQREGSVHNTRSSDHLCPDIDINDKRVNSPSDKCTSSNTQGREPENLDISRGEGEGQSRDLETFD